MNSHRSSDHQSAKPDSAMCTPPPSISISSHFTKHKSLSEDKQQSQGPLKNNFSSNSLSLAYQHKHPSSQQILFEDLTEATSPNRRAGSFNNLVMKTPDMLYRKTIGGKIKQLFSHSGGGGGGSGSGDKSSANSSKTNSLTRGTIPPFTSGSTGRKEKKKRKQRQQDRSGDIKERDSWSVSDDGFDNDNEDEDDDDVDDDDDDLENDQSGQSEDESDSNDWLESHSDNGAIAGSSNKRSASLQYSNSARGPDGQKRIKKVGGKAVAKSKQMHKQLKKAFLSPLSAANRNLGKSPSNNSLANANNSNDHQQTTPITTSSLSYPHGIVHGGSGDDLLRRPDGGLNSAPSGLRRTSLALSDTPLTSSTHQDASVLTGRSGTAGGASSDRNSSASASSFHKALNLSLSNAVISEKDRQKQQVEKLFRKTLKEANDVQKRKEELESKMTEYRRRDPGDAAAIITKYEERLRELRLVLEGYADKLQSADPDNELVLKHLAKLRKRSNSLSNPTMMEGSLSGAPGGSGSNFDKGHHPMSSHDRHHRSNQDDTRSTGSHDQHRHLDLNKQLSASREEDMEHPTEGNYASDYDIKLLQEEIQSHAAQLTERWQQELETFKSEYVKRMQELNETITHKCGEVETHINTLLTQKLTELDYDLRDRNEMVEQQLATLSEDIHSIDQRTNHQVNDVETMYNDRITALEARLVDVEKSHFSGSGKSNFIEDLKDADVMTLANRILQSLLVLVISFVFVFANILKIVSNTISTPQRAIIFVCSLVFLIIAYITRDSTTRWMRSLFT